MITTQDDLAAALLTGGIIECDPTVTIALTEAMSVAVPTTVRCGTFTCATGPAFLLSSSGVGFSEDVSVTGPGGDTYDPTQKLIYALGTQSAPLSDIEISGCRLSGSAGHNIWAEWCVDSGIVGNAITGFLGSGVMVISGQRVAVDGNAVSDGQIPTGQSNVYGIAVSDLLNTQEARSQHCTVTGNRVSLIDWEGIDTHGGLGIVAANNTITACRRSIALVVGNSTRTAAPTGCVVSGNAIDGTGARVTPDIGIFLAGASGMAASATITGNAISGYDASGASPIAAMNVDQVNTVVGGNSRPYVPWTPITLSGGWTANASFPPMYMVDGDTVTLRGGVIPPSGGIAGNPAVGSLASPMAWPAVRDFFAATKGSNAGAGSGVLNVDVSGNLRIDYGTTSDTYTYWLAGSYQAA